MKFFRILLRMFFIGLAGLALIAFAGFGYHEFAPVFGGNPDKRSLERFAKSQQFFDGTFRNLMPTQVSTPSDDRDSSLMDWILPPEGKNPDVPLPSKQINQTGLEDDTFVWLGHSTIIINTGGTTIVTDPIFNRASPVPFTGNPFPMEKENSINDLPKIDIVLISHDHYDHLDYRAVKDIAPKVDRFFVPLGVGAHLRRWGVDEEKILEMDWFDRHSYRGLELIFTPARHFSGRRLDNQNSTLWGSWIIQSDSMNVYFSGDGGYSDTFAELGEAYGPFDLAFLENGAYSLDWAQIHMLPEEAVQAAIDLNAKLLFPIHWGKFDLALHPWDEPIIRLKNEAQKRQVNVVTPFIGEAFRLDNYPQRQWW